MNKHSESIFPMDKRKKYKPRYLKVPYLKNRELPIFITDTLEVDADFTAFAEYEAEQHLSTKRLTKDYQQSYDSHINALSSSLISLSIFLSKRKLSWKNFNDTHIDDYKYYALENIYKKTFVKG